MCIEVSRELICQPNEKSVLVKIVIDNFLSCIDMNLIIEKKKSRFREHNFSLQWKSEGKIVSETPIKKRIRPKARQQKLFFGCALLF
jgi:hypothetical protein